MATALLRTDETIAGVDEAGRGPLLGSVFAGCVVLPAFFEDENEPKPLYLEIKDSKKLSARKRELLVDYIKRNALAWGVGSATAAEIDVHNVLNATYMAMHRAIDAADAYNPDVIDELYIDGPRFAPYERCREGWMPSRCIPDGDATHMCIAAASILAKVAHDEHIKELVDADPTLDEKYGISSNMGYGTKKHMDGLKTHGVHTAHRKTFAPVRRTIEEN